MALTGAAFSSQKIRLGFSLSEINDNGLPKGWAPLHFKKIKKHTEYTVVNDEGRAAVKAVSDRSASALVTELDMDIGKTPILSWSWKIQNILPNGNATKKSGDDFAARVYVMFKYDPGRAGLLKKAKYEAAKLYYGEYPPDSALNYIWANKLPKGKAIPNAFAENAIMIAVRSGNGEAGRWVSERKNIVEDYRKYFGADPPPVEGVAIMTDSDNTGGKAIAWFSEIRLSAE